MIIKHQCNEVLCSGTDFDVAIGSDVGVGIIFAVFYGTFLFYFYYLLYLFLFGLQRTFMIKIPIKTISKQSRIAATNTKIVPLRQSSIFLEND